MIVTFKSSSFNTSMPEKHFISTRRYGGDLANWLVNELARRDVSAQPMIGQRDAGWVVGFRFRKTSYDFFIQYRDPDWVGLFERRRGVTGHLFRRKQKNVEFDAVLLMDSILKSSELISDVRWHYDDTSDSM